MPKAAKKPCAFPGCRVLIEYNERYCAAHKHYESARQAESNREYDSKRPERHHFYHSHEWQKMRRRFLAQHPLCEMCLLDNRISAAVIVDHIVEISDGGSPVDPANLQALCVYHHNQKTAAERKKRCQGMKGR
ncbi:MAG: HNH endonuclease [Synergistes sp.]|nr:HNH endonuclease [Synergistes sp.]